MVFVFGLVLYFGIWLRFGCSSGGGTCCGFYAYGCGLAVDVTFVVLITVLDSWV